MRRASFLLSLLAPDGTGALRDIAVMTFPEARTLGGLR